jgi:hypothetical protein
MNRKGKETQVNKSILIFDFLHLLSALRENFLEASQGSIQKARERRRKV